LAFGSVSAVAAGTFLFLDANILVYALTDKSAQCRALLQRCLSEDVYGVCSFNALSEVTHTLMLMEAKEKGLTPTAKYLNEHPDQVRNLTDYWVQVSRILSMKSLLLIAEDSTITTAQSIRARTGLLTNDSLILATMREYGISQLATQDSGFESAAGVLLYRVDDL
jgi:predicted nucleic acid-binding protein